MNHSDLLRQLDACSDACSWYNGRDSREAWHDCERGDWLLWIAAKLGVERKLIVLAACDCAETALQYVPAGEGRPRLAIETARRWARGEATLDVRAAATAAAAAAYAVYDAAAPYDAATAAAADAADAASYAAYAAAAYAAASYAAYAAAAAAIAATAAAAARTAARRQCAELVRARIPWVVIEQVIAEESHP